MFEAARVDDDIGHSGALAGMIAGTIVGGLIAAAGGILGRRDVYSWPWCVLSWRGHPACWCQPLLSDITPGSWRPPPGIVLRMQVHRV